eukprot:2278048-Prymnesium_polylepis.1
MPGAAGKKHVSLYARCRPRSRAHRTAERVCRRRLTRASRGVCTVSRLRGISCTRQGHTAASSRRSNRVSVLLCSWSHYRSQKFSCNKTPVPVPTYSSAQQYGWQQSHITGPLGIYTLAVSRRAIPISLHGLRFRLVRLRRQWGGWCSCECDQGSRDR